MPAFADPRPQYRGFCAGYFQLRLADRQLERLPLAAPFRSSQLIGGLNEAHPPSLLVAVQKP